MYIICTYVVPLKASIERLILTDNVCMVNEPMHLSIVLSEVSPTLCMYHNMVGFVYYARMSLHGMFSIG